MGFSAHILYFFEGVIFIEMTVIAYESKTTAMKKYLKLLNSECNA